MVILSTLVGNRTGPLIRRSLVLARSMSSEQTFSRAATLREERVMRIVCIFCVPVVSQFYECNLLGQFRFSGRARR